MKKLLLASAFVFLTAPAFAQFIPPSQVPTFNNLGGTLTGIGTGTSITLGEVRQVPAFNVPGGAGDLNLKVQQFLGQVTPRPN